MSRSSPSRQVRKNQQRKQKRAQQQASALELSKQLRAQLVEHFQKLHAGKTDHTEYASLIHKLALSTDVELIQTFVHEREFGPRAAPDAPDGTGGRPDTAESPEGAHDAPGAPNLGSTALAEAGFVPVNDEEEPE